MPCFFGKSNSDTNSNILSKTKKNTSCLKATSGISDVDSDNILKLIRKIQISGWIDSCFRIFYKTSILTVSPSTCRTPSTPLKPCRVYLGPKGVALKVSKSLKTKNSIYIDTFRTIKHISPNFSL